MDIHFLIAPIAPGGQYRRFHALGCYGRGALVMGAFCLQGYIFISLTRLIPRAVFQLQVHEINSRRLLVPTFRTMLGTGPKQTISHPGSTVSRLSLS